MPGTLRADIEPSRIFRILLVAVALTACGAILYSGLTWPPRLLLVCVALVYGGHCWRAQGRQRGTLRWRGVWFWRGADGVERALTLRRSTAWPGLIVLVFVDIERGERFVLTLLPDSFGGGSDSPRRLRLLLNHFPVFDAAD